ncbi:MAG: GDP-L-fucose synthase family protein [Bdellovibrionales bacterium]
MGYFSNYRVLLTGATGFLGKHVHAKLKSLEPRELVAVSSRDFDLTRESEVEKMFREAKPTLVFHLAGLVGGILANKERPADFFYRNIMMGTLVFHYAYKAGVEKIVAAGAGCGYPEHANMPLIESSLWDGRPQKESAPYSLAKRMLAVQSLAYHQQYGFKSVICIPGNIYGEYDNFNLTSSHVIPALVRKFVEATRDNKPEVEVWGTGTPTRDYIYAPDVAEGMMKACEHYTSTDVVNISSGEETSVSQICEVLKSVTGYKGQIKWLTDRPEGQKRRWFDVTKAKRDLNWSAATTLEVGLRNTVQWFRDNLNSPDLRR